MNKYRIVEYPIGYLGGRFIPQKRFLWFFWISWGDEDHGIVTYDEYKDAYDFIAYNFILYSTRSIARVKKIIHPITLPPKI